MRRCCRCRFWARRILRSLFIQPDGIQGSKRGVLRPVGPFKASIGCFSKEMACRTPERHVWWDLYSPTEAVDALVANWSWSPPPQRPGSDSTSICSPISLQQLAGAPALQA
ncbi:hypothetical protein EJB05_02077, partial [Eragrostis curvula]